MSNHLAATLSSDRPATDPDADLFGHAPFAEHLAKSICRLKASDGLVIALHGPWGSGKTTVLNFVRYYIEKAPTAEQPVLVTFNPWWFAGQENLARAFLGQLQAVLPQKFKEFKKLGDRIGDFADAIGGVASYWGLGYIGKLIALFKQRPPDVPALKKTIGDLLTQQGKRILIVVDDIDRLSADETRQLFKVIKALADFPNVIYLLAFDWSAATNALEDEGVVSGAEYLEKIVQVPFEIPIVDRATLHRALFARLDSILSDTPDGEFDSTYWGNVFYGGIASLINVPRDIVRLTNTLTVTYPVVRGETNPVDFIAIEALRVFLPDTYNVIRSQGEHFVGYSRDRDEGMDENALRVFHDGWLAKVPVDIRSAIRDLVERLFPRLESVWSKTGYGADWMPRWRRERRICSPEIFPIYFRLAIPEGSVSSQELTNLLRLGSHPDQLASAFLRATEITYQDGTSKARALLERLTDYVDEGITPDEIPGFVMVLLDKGDQLLLEADEQRGMFDFGGVPRVTRLIYHLVKRLEGARRHELLVRGLTDGQALRVPIYLVGALEEECGKSKQQGGESLLTEDQVAELKRLLLAKLIAASQSGILAASRHLPRLLAAWRQWGDPQDAINWARQVTVHDDALIKFVASFLQKTFSQGFGDRVVRVKYRLNPQWIKEYLDPDETSRRLNALRDTMCLDDPARRAIDQFLTEQRMLDEGKNPDAPFAFDD